MDHACLHAKLTKHGVESSKTGFHLLNPKMAVKKHQNTIFPAKKTYQTYALLLTDKLKIYYIISLAGATSSLQSENVRQYIHPVPCYIFFCALCAPTRNLPDVEAREQTPSLAKCPGPATRA